MEVKLYKPKNPLLQKRIEGFYTLTHSAEVETTYLTFPHILTIVTAIKDARVTVRENFVKIANDSNNKVETNFTCEFNKPVLVRYEGNTCEVVVLFKPLGINAFLDHELDKYGEGHFPIFEPFDDYKTSMSDILLIENDEVKIEKLEDYWMSKFKGFEHPFLFDVIDDLMNEDDSQLTISEIAEKYKISRVTLNKQFKLHMCRTPSQFRKIVRFRNAMKRHANKLSNNHLTDITYYVNYFDQSHMIKDFKALTGYSPKEFFSKISKIENGQINWLFL